MGSGGRESWPRANSLPAQSPEMPWHIDWHKGRRCARSPGVAVHRNALAQIEYRFNVFVLPLESAGIDLGHDDGADQKSGLRLQQEQESLHHGRYFF